MTASKKMTTIYPDGPQPAERMVKINATISPRNLRYLKAKAQEKSSDISKVLRWLIDQMELHELKS